jgi:hypothetical protein
VTKNKNKKKNKIGNFNFRTISFIGILSPYLYENKAIHHFRFIPKEWLFPIIGGATK